MDEDVAAVAVARTRTGEEAVDEKTATTSTIKQQTFPTNKPKRQHSDGEKIRKKQDTETRKGFR
jgi:hypothetical protein